MELTKEDIVNDIIDNAYTFVVDQMKAAGIECDTGSTDVIFYNDEKQKKTFAINVFQHECKDYEGD